MKSEKENCLRDENDREIAVVTKHGEPHELNIGQIVIFGIQSIYRSDCQVVSCDKVWPSTTVSVSILSFSKLPQISSSHLLERIHKSIKLIDVFLIHRQFLRKWVLQIGKTKSSLGNGSLNAHFNSKKLVTRSSAIDWELMSSVRLASCGGFWNSL